jgi:hypothetical protein
VFLIVLVQFISTASFALQIIGDCRDLSEDQGWISECHGVRFHVTHSCLAADIGCARQLKGETTFCSESGETVLMIDLLKDLWGFMKERKKFWLAPIIIVMLLLGGLIVLAQGSAIAPFIYTLF